MKKILVTTLALSLVVVSALDARQVRTVRRGRSMNQPVTQKETARVMNANAQDLTNPMVPKAEKKDAASELLGLLKNNPDEFQLGKLYVERKAKMTEIQAKQDAIKAMNVGWFDFSNVDYKKAKEDLNLLKAELKEINQKISAQEKVVGRESSNAVRNAVGALVVVIGLAGVDYAFGSPVRTFLTETGSAAWAKGGEYVSSAKDYASSAYENYTPNVPVFGRKARAARAAERSVVTTPVRPVTATPEGDIVPNIGDEIGE